MRASSSPTARRPITKCSSRSRCSATSEAALDQGRVNIVNALTQHYSRNGGAQNQNKLDLDNVSSSALASWLQQNDPEHLGNTADAQTRYQAQAERRAANTATTSTAASSAPSTSLRGVGRSRRPHRVPAEAWLSGFSVRSVEIVGAQVGKVLQHQAELATLYSLGGMLVYLWFRFELIYGVAAVVACFHDTIITVGAFSLSNQEISLTVIAAILTLIGYSMNDTIVVFDRIRENLRLSRREPLADLVNRSINQTLSRTVLTSGLTFLTVLSLFLFGGEVLRGFSFALVVGILIGTYSSIAVAAPCSLLTRTGVAAAAKQHPCPLQRKPGYDAAVPLGWPNSASKGCRLALRAGAAAPGSELCYRNKPALSVGWTPRFRRSGQAGHAREEPLRVRFVIFSRAPEWRREQTGPPAVSIRDVNY